MRRALVALVVGVGWVAWSAGGAAADCMGPTVKHPGGEVDRSAKITITGETFGTNCYDTGPPPPGEGVLGTPATGIEVILVQGDTETVVAKGNADAEYGFTVDVTVPATLQPGAVTLTARTDTGGEAFDGSETPLTISGAPAPIDAPAADIVWFGPKEPHPIGGSGSAGSSGGDGSSSPWGIVVAGLVAVAIAASVGLGVIRVGKR